ncbi:hypothetical protein ATO3_24455 [Marinibacterium profundimaris]|uniref:Amidase domain-containing protein n=1 Tax=Marinibacterium profundimaris TaxID=1679460 RepID=A0A225NBT6_9RHOB|nr:hypothetical protein ATO3_24455 [Marinibacterium profundimaris]
MSGETGMRAALNSGACTAVDLVEATFAEIARSGEEGQKIFLRLFGDTARREAERADARIAAGETGPLLGIPVSVKDLLDVAGQVTTAGSRVLADAPPAKVDSAVVARLRAAGAIIIGHTGMTEFAYSGLGINPHFGTPLNPWDKATGRIPGGSSSGGITALAEGMCGVSIGTDTGGSIRIPSALCGQVGFKPSQSSVPRDGVFPLSWALDSVGPLARSVADARLTYEVISGTSPDTAPEAAAPRVLVPTNLVHDGADEVVAERFRAALDALVAAGWRIEHRALAPFDIVAEMGAIGNYAALEAWRDHSERLVERGDEYDPRVRSRIESGARLASDAKAQLDALRARYIVGMAEALKGYDAFLMPTVPLVAPPLDAFVDDAEYGRLNLLMLRNPTLVNLLDGCAVSLPIGEPGGAPVGLSICCTAGRDCHLLRLAEAAEGVVVRHR